MITSPNSRRSRNGTLAAVGLVTALAASLLTPPPSAHAAADITYEWQQMPNSVTVPAGVHVIEVQMSGGSGGNVGGAGAQIHGLLPVTPGQKLRIHTGERGQDGALVFGGLGANWTSSEFAGGDGGSSAIPEGDKFHLAGGGGGGVSLIRDSATDRVLAAAGGGGGGGGTARECQLSPGGQGGRGGRPWGEDAAMVAVDCNYQTHEVGLGGQAEGTRGENGRKVSSLEYAIGGAGGGGSGYPRGGTAGVAGYHFGTGGGGGDSFVGDLHLVPGRSSFFGYGGLRTIPHDGEVRMRIYRPAVQIDTAEYTYKNALTISGRITEPHENQFITYDVIGYYDGETTPIFEYSDILSRGEFSFSYVYPWPGSLIPRYSLPPGIDIRHGKQLRVVVKPSEEQLHPDVPTRLPDPVEGEISIVAPAAHTTTDLQVTPEAALQGAQRTYTAEVRVHEPAAGSGAGKVEFWQVDDAQGKIKKLGEADVVGPEPNTNTDIRPIATASISSSEVIPAHDRIQAFYSPDPPYYPSESAPTKVPYANATTTTQVAIDPVANYFGEKATATVTVRALEDGAAIPSGNVTFAGEEKSLDDDGYVEFDVSSRAVGHVTYEAIYLGAPGFEPSSGRVTHSVAALDTQLELRASETQVDFGQSVELTVSAQRDEPLTDPVAGEVEIWMNGEATGRVANLNKSSAKIEMPKLDAGTYEFEARLRPQEGHNPATSNLVHIDIAPLATAVEFQIGSTWRGRVAPVTSDEVVDDANIEIWALTSPGGIAEKLIEVTPLTAGVFEADIPELEAGEYQLVARYRGGGNFKPSESLPHAMVITGADNGTGDDEESGSDEDGDTGSDEDGDTGSDEDGDTGRDEDEENGTGEDGESGAGEDGESGAGEDGDSGTGEDGESGAGEDGDTGSDEDEENGTREDEENGTGTDGDVGDGADTDTGTDTDADVDAHNAGGENLPETGKTVTSAVIAMGILLVLGTALVAAAMPRVRR